MNANSLARPLKRKNHYCTNNLWSLHIFSHHCTFCASLHVKTSPAILSIKLLWWLF